MFKDLSLGVLEIFAEAQAPARAVTDEKHGNVRAAYLLVKRADNSEQWTKIKSDKAKLDARNAKRRALYKPKKPRPVAVVDPVARSRAKWAKAKDAVNAARRANYDPKVRSDRHKRTGH